MFLRDLSIGYPSRVVASGISLELKPGALTCLIGENGVGKSTLLRTLAGFQKPLSGKMLVGDGQTLTDVTALSRKQLSRLIAVVLTEKPDLQNTTVREMVALGRIPYTGFFGRLSEKDERIVDESLKTVGIADSQTIINKNNSTLKSGKEVLDNSPMREVEGVLSPSRKVSTLSDGERQKVMIARALAQQTRYIFLDEPTAFLDYPSKVRVMKMLKDLAARHGKTILLSTHDVEIALDMADTVVMMERNRIITGKPKTRKHEKITAFTADALLTDCQCCQ